MVYTKFLFNIFVLKNIALNFLFIIIITNIIYFKIYILI